MVRMVVPEVLVLVLLAAGAACGGEDAQPDSTPAMAPGPTATQVPATPVATELPSTRPRDPTSAAPPIASPAATPEPAPATVGPAPTRAPELGATPEPAKAPEPTAPAAMSEAEKLAAYAADHANKPGAIFVGDPTQLIGPPPHEGLMFSMPAELYTQLAGAALVGAPELQIPGHMFVYTSDYYRSLIGKANLTDPSELVSSGEEIEIQHVCLARALPPCVLIQAYLAPNIDRRTDGQVKISVISLAELQLDGQATLSQVSDGTLDMVNIFTGYVAGELPALEIQSLWGSAPDWETSYLTLTDVSEDIDRIMLEATGGSGVFNRNWFAGSDQWFYSEKPLQAVKDYNGLKIRSNSASMSDFIRGMGGQDEFTSIAELYTSLDQGVVDVAVYGALLAVSAKLYEVTDYMAGPIIGFGYTNNVINKDIWNEIPEDLQQIMIEEGAKAELEGLRLAPFQNVAAVAINQSKDMQPVPFSPEIYQHIQTVVLPEYVIPGWLRRLGYPGKNGELVAIFNEKLSPYHGFWINEDGTIKNVAITKGPRANQ